MLRFRLCRELPPRQRVVGDEREQQHLIASDSLFQTEEEAVAATTTAMADSNSPTEAAAASLSCQPWIVVREERSPSPSGQQGQGGHPGGIKTKVVRSAPGLSPELRNDLVDAARFGCLADSFGFPCYCARFCRSIKSDEEEGRTLYVEKLLRLTTTTTTSASDFASADAIGVDAPPPSDAKASWIFFKAPRSYYPIDTIEASCAYASDPPPSLKVDTPGSVRLPRYYGYSRCEKEDGTTRGGTAAVADGTKREKFVSEPIDGKVYVCGEFVDGASNLRECFESELLPRRTVRVVMARGIGTLHSASVPDGYPLPIRPGRESKGGEQICGWLDTTCKRLRRYSQMKKSERGPISVKAHGIVKTLFAKGISKIIDAQPRATLSTGDLQLKNILLGGRGGQGDGGGNSTSRNEEESDTVHLGNCEVLVPLAPLWDLVWVLILDDQCSGLCDDNDNVLRGQNKSLTTSAATTTTTTTTRATLPAKSEDEQTVKSAAGNSVDLKPCWLDEFAEACVVYLYHARHCQSGGGQFTEDEIRVFPHVVQVKLAWITTVRPKLRATLENNIVCMDRTWQYWIRRVMRMVSTGTAVYHELSCLPPAVVDHDDKADKGGAEGRESPSLIVPNMRRPTSTTISTPLTPSPPPFPSVVRAILRHLQRQQQHGSNTAIEKRRTMKRPILIHYNGSFCPIHAGHLSVAVTSSVHAAATYDGYVCGVLFSPCHQNYLTKKKSKNKNSNELEEGDANSYYSSSSDRVSLLNVAIHSSFATELGLTELNPFVDGFEINFANNVKDPTRIRWRVARFNASVKCALSLLRRRKVSGDGTAANSDRQYGVDKEGGCDIDKQADDVLSADMGLELEPLMVCIMGSDNVRQAGWFCGMDPQVRGVIAPRVPPPPPLSNSSATMAVATAAAPVPAIPAIPPRHRGKVSVCVPPPLLSSSTAIRTAMMTGNSSSITSSSPDSSIVDSITGACQIPPVVSSLLLHCNAGRPPPSSKSVSGESVNEPSSFAAGGHKRRASSSSFGGDDKAQVGGAEWGRRRCEGGSRNWNGNL